MNKNIKEKLGEVIELWADIYLVGKPAILANAVYFNMEQKLMELTKNISDIFIEKS